MRDIDSHIFYGIEGQANLGMYVNGSKSWCSSTEQRI